MDILRQHEIFEIEVLDKMNSAKVLEPLVFGGGTMLRLCHENDRYSVDLDFWFIKRISQLKFHKLLFELRSAEYPKRLKIEIRRQKKDCDFQEKIAFTRFTTKQVLLKAHTLNQTMKNKISAFLDRGEIRDCFDIEFLLRRGVELPALTDRQHQAFQKKVGQFNDRDFKVTLGSILEAEIRNYYVKQRFAYLEEKLVLMRSQS